MAMGNGLVSMRGVAAFAGGAAAGILASRMLPPFLAQAVGSARASMGGGDPFEALARDHRDALELLDRIEQTRDDAVFRRTQLLLRVKRRLTAHALAEEDVIYPMLRDQANEIEDTRHLYAEHAEIKMHLHALEQMPKDHPGWLDRVRALRHLIETHARQEEEVDFPKLRRMLSDQETARLSGSVRREKALVL